MTDTPTNDTLVIPCRCRYALLRWNRCPPDGQPHPAQSSPSSESDSHWRGFFMSGGGMAKASAAYEWSEDEAIHVEVECDDGRPDVLDEITRRAAWLLAESIQAVTDQTKTET